MKYFSTFSGIGGFELGIQLAYENIRESRKSRQLEGVRNMSNTQGDGQDEQYPPCIGYSEIDKYAIQTYEKHFNHKNYGDITKINEQGLPDFDLLCGGFPCQSFSIAGKRGGFEDTRGTLFFDIARIIKFKRPSLLLLENVKGLLSHDEGKTFNTIILTLDELGYDVQWQVLNSKNHGVPQNRERVFIIGHLRGTPRPEVFPFGEANNSSIKVLARGKHQQDRIYDTSGIIGLPAGTKGSTPHLTKILQLNNPTHSNDRVYGTDGVSPTLNTAQGGNRQPFIKIDKKGNRKKTQDVAATLTGGAHSGGNHSDMDLLLQESRIRRLTPTECERLQGFPDGWTEGVSDTQRYKTLGNAVTVNVIKDIVEKLF